MEKSPLSKLPPELREQILSYAVADDDEAVSDAILRSYHASDIDFAIWVSHRHTVLAACRQLQKEGLYAFLRSTSLVWNCQVHSYSHERGERVFKPIPYIYDNGLVTSFRSIGVILEDGFLHSIPPVDPLSLSQTWENHPDLVLRLYTRAAFATGVMREHRLARGFRHDQIFFKHRYKLLVYTDAAAFQPISRTLRHTWKRDNIEIPIDAMDVVKSLHYLDEASRLLEQEHRVNVEAIEAEIEREDEMFIAGRSESQVRWRYGPTCHEFLETMKTMFWVWLERIQTYHIGLMYVVRMAYVAEHDCVEKRYLSSIRDQFTTADKRGGHDVVYSVIRTLSTVESTRKLDNPLDVSWPDEQEVQAIRDAMNTSEARKRERMLAALMRSLNTG